MTLAALGNYHRGVLDYRTPSLPVYTPTLYTLEREPYTTQLAERLSRNRHKGTQTNLFIPPSTYLLFMGLISINNRLKQILNSHGSTKLAAPRPLITSPSYIPAAGRMEGIETETLV